jgi:Putative adhesin
MKFRSVAIGLFALVVASFAQAGDYSFKEPFSQTAPFNATGSLSLANVNGRVEIRTWDKNQILVEGEKSAQTDEELKQIELTIDLTDAHAGIKVHLPKRSSGWWFFGNTIRASVRFTITVPATASIERLQTVNSEVTIDGLRGSVDAESVNGDIHATGLGGDAHFATVNGAIRADFGAVAPHQEHSFKTVNGSITVGLPKDAGVALSSSVVNGHISCDFPLTLGESGHGRHLSGTIGDGRASLRAETVNGNIAIKQR